MKSFFYNGQINLNLWKRRFKKDLGLVCTKSNASRQVSFNLWRDSTLPDFVPFLLGPDALYLLLYLFLFFFVPLFSCAVHSFF
jgi:hypothetical protein